MRFERTPQCVNISKIPHSRGIFILGSNLFFVFAFFAFRFSRHTPFSPRRTNTYRPACSATDNRGFAISLRTSEVRKSGFRYHHQAHSAVSYNVFSPSLFFLPTRGTVVRSPLLLRVPLYHECLPNTEDSPTGYASPPFTCGIIGPNRVFACFPLRPDRNMILNSLLRPD